MKKEIEAFVNAASEQELDAAWNNLSAEEQRVFEQLMEEDSPEDALAFFAQLYDDTPKEQTSETVSISENEIYFKRKPLTIFAGRSWQQCAPASSKRTPCPHSCRSRYRWCDRLSPWWSVLESRRRTGS